MTIKPFTPAQERAEDLDRRTVGRDRLLHVLGERLRLAATTSTRQHTLLVGPRGSGKTHLLQVVLHRAGIEPEVSDGLVVARIGEDAVGLIGYPDLLRNLARRLGVDVARERDPGALERALLDAAGDRTLVIVLENLDKVFRALGEPGQRDLRSWVETSGRVLILAATPALFDSVRDRGAPWFGGLIETPMEGLTAEEGRELLTVLARDRGDQALAEALQTEQGEARIRAVSQLTGGSARIWMVLSECLTIESLDELIPAVEGLVEGLVPYYQQLLWDLPPNHQAIVRQLAEGASAAMTAKEIALETGLSQQTVSKALDLLAEGRWVRGEKLRKGDQRRTWYSLCEPMLRHHFQWRETEGEPLRLIVELLRHWYDATQLRHHLSFTEPASLPERYLAEALRAIPHPYDLATDVGTPEALLAAAREWLRGDDPIYPAEAGLYAELCVALARDPAANVSALMTIRREAHPSLAMPAESAVQALVDAASGDPRLEDLLQVAVQLTDGDTSTALLLVAAGLVGKRAPKKAYDLLTRANAEQDSALELAIALERAFCVNEMSNAREALREVSALLPRIAAARGSDDAMTLKARTHLATCTGRSGDAREALRLYQELLPDHVRVLGPDHRSTLVTRAWVAYYTGRLGDAGEALRLYQELLLDHVRVYGPDHRETLATRHQVAHYTGELGDAGHALRLFRELLPDEIRALGPDHRYTLSTRAQVAYYTGRLGDAGEALRLYQELLLDRVRVLGRDDQYTLSTRAQVAYYTGEVGDAGHALRLFRELLPDEIRALGPDHRNTLSTRARVAYYTGQLGDAGHALRLFRELLPDEIRALGPDHRNTLSTRARVAYYTGQLGDAGEALRLYQELLLDHVRVLGPDDQYTLSTRAQVAYYTGEVGDTGSALRLYQELLLDELRVSGPDHRETLATRHQVAHYTGELGDAGDALRLFRELLPDEIRALGPDHPNTLVTCQQVAYYTGRVGDADMALRMCQELLPDVVRVLGPDHLNTLATRQQVAYYTGETGDVDKALRMYQELLPDVVRVLGRDDALASSVRSGIDRYAQIVADRSGVSELLARARTGDEEARIRLPAELRPLVDEGDHPREATEGPAS